MVLKRKGMISIEMLIILALGLIVLAAAAPYILRYFGIGKTQANLALYKSTCDYDGDTFTTGDTCPCDPGKLTDSKTYWLKDKPDCLFTINSQGKYLFEEKLSTSASKATCQKAFDNLKIAAGDPTCGTGTIDIAQGFDQKPCALKVLQIDPASNTLLTRCAKTDKECDNLLLDYCKDKV
jgi:hypothetical protein